MKSIAALLTAVVTALAAQAAVLNVPANYSDIQSAINAAQQGDTVLVGHGVWGNINYRGKGIAVASRFILDGDPAHIDSTIIDGTNPYHSDTASCVLITSNTPATSGDTSAALIGFTLRNGQGTVWDDEHNPGSKYHEGGGILIQYLAPRIRHNRIIGNSARYKTGCVSAGGGAIRCGDGYPQIENNLIALNQAGGYGGAIVLNYSGAVIRNNLIVRNRVGDQFGGGAVWVYNNGTYPRILANNTIADNQAGPSSTGGIRFYATVASMQNSILWGNSPTQLLTQGATVSVKYCDVQGGFAGTGNIDADPFWADDRYYLMAESPCIDAGNDSSAYNDPENTGNPGQALWPSLGGLRNDMGAYGGPLRSDLYDLPPYITSASPSNGQVRVAYDVPLWVAFSQAMAPATVSCELSDPGIFLDSSWSTGHDTLYLSHAQNFANFTRYSLRVLSGLGEDGQPLAPLPDSVSFRTLDTVRPKLYATQPADGQTGVATNAIIRLWFSKPVSKNTLTYIFSDTSYHFTLYQTSDSVITLGHVGHLFVGGTTYSLELTAFQDTAGNPMGQSLVSNPFTFTTAGTGVMGSPLNVAGRFFLAPAKPNPSTSGGRVRLEFELECEGQAELAVYDILGHKLADLYRGCLPAGVHSIDWECRDRQGRKLAAGVYFYRLKAGERTATERLVVVR
jgi:hypothetical protein